MYYSTSIRLIQRRAKNYKKYHPLIYIPNFSKKLALLDKNAIFLGWGYKKSGIEAMQMPKYLLLEDGFIRSIGLGVQGYPAFSIVEDENGMHYDAFKNTTIQQILNEYDFKNDEKLLSLAKDTIELIKKYKISKYNINEMKLPNIVKNSKKEKVLIIAQTAGDNSLKYGRAYEFKPKDIIISALEENPGKDIFVKIHPDVLTGKRKSSIDIDLAKKYCKVLTQNTNPILLLEEFDKVYTQTSQMGFEAAFLGKEVVTFGMPFYAGWGITKDKLQNTERKRKLTPLEVFAAAYILYSKYYNPYEKRECDIIETIEEIVKRRKKYV